MPVLIERTSFHRRAVERIRHIRSILETRATHYEFKAYFNALSNYSAKKAFSLEMQAFSKVLSVYASGSKVEVDFDKILPPSSTQLLPYDQLPHSVDDASSLQQLAVLKLNGGLGTSMGISGAKCALEVKDGRSFLDLSVQQIAHVNATHGVNVPLLLMTSFKTHEDTLRIIERYDSTLVRIVPFMQSKYPRILKDSLKPFYGTGDDRAAWYPPGDGDLYTSLYRCGVLDGLLKEGKKYLFVSNSDNLGAVVDSRILNFMIHSQTDFVMEVTDKVAADYQGGALINYDGSLRLLGMDEMPSERSCNIWPSRHSKTFNTNNLWINLHALKQIMDDGGMDLDIIANPKVIDDGRSVIQLETAAGAAIRYFKSSLGIRVPTSRFLPVKSCTNLLLLRSDIYTLDHGCITINRDKNFTTLPVIELSDHFRKIQNFHSRFTTIPSLIDLDHLTVSGNVYFGRNVTLRGTVVVIANEGQRIDIPDGSILENRLISGDLKVTEL